MATAENDGIELYQPVEPVVEIGCPLIPGAFNEAYQKWPNLADVFPWFSPAVKTSRDEFVVDIDLEKLKKRLKDYFDSSLSDDDVAHSYPVAMATKAGFNSRQTRQSLMHRGIKELNFVCYDYRPFDQRWVYWEPETDLLDRKRESLFAALKSAPFLTSRQKAERTREGSPFFVTSCLADYHLTRPGSSCFPLHAPQNNEHPELAFGKTESGSQTLRPNLSDLAVSYLRSFEVNKNDQLWMHVLAVGHSPAYLTENSVMLWQDWPRIPLPAARQDLEASAALGRKLAALLDVQQPVPGVTTGKIDPSLKTIGLISHISGGQINEADDLALTAGWGNPGRGGITMPSSGDAQAPLRRRRIPRAHASGG